MPAYHSLNEALTRYGLIDPQLTKRGWNLSDRCSVSSEVPVDGYDASPVDRIITFLFCYNSKMLKASGVWVTSFR